MKINIRIIQIIFGIPWLVFGMQHFLYADFVANLVPAFFPQHVFWVYLTGAAMIAGGLSLIVNRKSALAAELLGLMLVMFFLLIQGSKLAGGDASTIIWTRVLQDFAIASGLFMLAGILAKREKDEVDFLQIIGNYSRYVFAAILITFGIQQFFNLDFLTAKVPEYLPFRILFVYLTGVLMIVGGVSVLFGRKSKSLITALGAFLTILILLRYLPLFLTGTSNALLLTAAMLDLEIVCGVFILAFAPLNTETEPLSD